MQWIKTCKWFWRPYSHYGLHNTYIHKIWFYNNMSAIFYTHTHDIHEWFVNIHVVCSPYRITPLTSPHQQPGGVAEAVKNFCEIFFTNKKGDSGYHDKTKGIHTSVNTHQLVPQVLQQQSVISELHTHCTCIRAYNNDLASDIFRSSLAFVRPSLTTILYIINRKTLS